MSKQIVIKLENLSGENIQEYFKSNKWWNLITFIRNVIEKYILIIKS